MLLQQLLDLRVHLLLRNWLIRCLSIWLDHGPDLLLLSLLLVPLDLAEQVILLELLSLQLLLVHLLGHHA